MVYIYPLFIVISDFCINLSAGLLGTAFIRLFVLKPAVKKNRLDLTLNLLSAIIFLSIGYIFKIL
ncbi:hypothetical protein A3F32_02485 [Candidatus Roizmanbacteria bacterium RIFCSPHIGHO2_12_FULL_42_10]|uniref:Uncharacterized protein n=1 Tax=Candidatus Roizmanbacteria bacterium RIFCSPHIGHO2_12_FULL_42_10 TaxID=1802053 RepID=A0A1F7I5L4_9BACT|nr:MAG: hypothetical protein A3F32_02485 [Candidatus Roizmanbacteria bacterium RIFCSPHIGHO2_12_FULL_42_10]